MTYDQLVDYIKRVSREDNNYFQYEYDEDNYNPYDPEESNTYGYNREC